MTTQTFDKITFLGLSVRSLSINGIQTNTSEGSFNFSLVREPGQTFQLDTANPGNILGSGLVFQFGSLELHGNILSWEETQVNTQGTGIINVQLKEAAVDEIREGVNTPGILIMSQLLSIHNNQIISLNEGWEMYEESPSYLPSSFLSSGITDISLTPAGGINNIFNLEVADIPRTNIARLLKPGHETVMFSVGWNGDVNDVRFESLSNLASLIIRDRYPLRENKGTQGKVLTQINTQFSDKGVRTKYTFTEFISNLDSRINQVKDSLANSGKHENWRVTPRGRIHNGFWSGFDPPLSVPPVDLEFYRPQDLQLDDIIEALGQLGHVGWSIDLEQLEGGLGVIVDKAGSGPFYRVRRLNNIDIDPETFQRFAPDTFLSSEWERVRNLAESVDSPGYLLPGTQVTIQIYKMEDLSTGVPFMEQSPQTFSPPIPEI